MSSGGSSSPSISPVGNSSDSGDEMIDIDEFRQSLKEMNDFETGLVDLKRKEQMEIAEVESKYNKLRKPLYDKRAVAIEKIPNFWANAICNHPKIGMLVDEEEEDCLDLLKKLEVEWLENVAEGFRIRFVFADENPFFDNSELVKEFPLGLGCGAEKSTSTTIEWKENMDLSKKQGQIIDARKERGLKMQTFFSWFSNNKNPAHDCIAELIKYDLWPNALHYYSRFATHLDDVDYEGYWDDPEDLEDDDEDEDDDYDESPDDDDGEGNGTGEEEETDDSSDDDDGAGNGE